jgi:hypothetical protein
VELSFDFCARQRSFDTKRKNYIIYKDRTFLVILHNIVSGDDGVSIDNEEDYDDGPIMGSPYNANKKRRLRYSL